MRKARILVFALLLAGSSLHAEKLANGLEFQAPAGWTVKIGSEAALLNPPDMVMEPGGKDPSELYLVALIPGVKDLQDPQLLPVLQAKYIPAETHPQPVGAPQSFQAAGGAGYVYRYDAVSQGVALRLQLYLVGLRNGGVAGLVAIGRPGLLMIRGTNIASVAASLVRQAGFVPAAATATATGALAAQWDQRLRGHKLYQFSGYTSSYGSGGTNSQKTLLLRPDGTYEFHSSSSTSVYVSGASGGSVAQNGAQGRWRIGEQGGNAVLELAPSSGPVETIALTANGSQTLLNGRRWLVGN